MLSYLTIFAASLSGYASMPVWTIAAATVAVASLSYAESHHLYRRGTELGLSGQVDATLIGSLFNALLGTTVAYVGGVVVRLLSLG
jgi:hypothetical protein